MHRLNRGFHHHPVLDQEGFVCSDCVPEVSRQYIQLEQPCCDLDPLSWKDETFGYTIPEEGKDHAKSTKDLHSGV